MVINLKKGKNCEADLEVELNEEDLRQYVQKAGQNIAASVVMDGFRSGKVPLDVLRKKIGDEKILEVAMDMAVKDSFFQAIKKEKLDIISSYDLKVSDNTAKKLKYGLKLLLFPEVKLGEYKHLGITFKPVEVEDADLENTLHSARQLRASYKETEAGAEEGSRLEINFEVKERGVMIEGGKSENHPLVLGEGNFIPGFEDQLKGMKKGEVKQFVLQAPEDYYQKNIAGKKLDFTVIVNSVKMAILPEINDEFVKTLGRFSSVEELKQSIRQGLRQEKEQKEHERVRRLILDRINEKSEMTVPSRMIEEQLDSMIDNFDQSLHSRGLELGLYLAQIKKTQENLRKEWREKAERQIRQGLIMRAIGKLEGITVSDEEVEEAVSVFLGRSVAFEEEQKKMNAEQIRSRTNESLLNEKVFEYLESVNGRSPSKNDP